MGKVCVIGAGSSGIASCRCRPGGVQVAFHPYMRLLRGERARTEGVRRPLRAAPAAQAAAVQAS